MRQKRVCLGVLLLLALAVAVILTTGGLIDAARVDFSASWFTVDGGGRSAGAQYGLAGIAGQPDAGLMDSPRFRLEGGFGPGIRVAGQQKLFIPLVSK